MMEAIRAWAVTVAVASLAGGVVWLMAPKGSVRKSLRVVVAVFLVAAFLSPLLSRSSRDFGWALPAEHAMPANQELEAEILRQLRQTVETSIRAQLQAELRKQGVAVDTELISVATDILSDGSIEIVSVRVIVPAEALARSGELRGDLLAATGLDVTLEGG
ncbi:MAG: stage III sporulation protein AF [Oscillospiraceae bacterium]|nr:stage III sporulation protein AF [Oscillospiraceae bacterium]